MSLSQMLAQILYRFIEDLSETFRWLFPPSLAEQLRLMYGRGEISRQEYHELIKKLSQGLLNRGYLEAYHLRALRQQEARQVYLPRPVDRRVERSLERLYLDKAHLEDMHEDAKLALTSLQADLENFQQQAETFHETAQQALPDDAGARLYLDLREKMLTRSQVLDERISSLRENIRRIEILQKELAAYETELKLLNSDVSLVSIEASIREYMHIR